MEFIYIILALLALAGLVAFLFFGRKKKRLDEGWKQDPTSRAFAILRSITPVLTPNGHKVYFERGTDPKTFSLAAVDAGVEKTFEKCECAGYPVDRTKHKVVVVVFNSIIAPESGIPAYKIYIGAGNAYYGSEWDMEAGKGLEVDHYVLAAGQQIAVGEPFGDVIIIPHYDGEDAQLSTVVEYEMEHVALAWYDGDKYEATKVHGSGQGHPLIPDCPPTESSIRGFVAERKAEFKATCGKDGMAVTK